MYSLEILEPLPGRLASFANDVNSTGDAVGGCTTADQSDMEPCQWRSGTAIPTPSSAAIPGGGPATFSAINDAGDQVGVFFISDIGPFAFMIPKNGSFRNLRPLSQDPSRDSDARRINASQVAGSTSDSQGLGKRACTWDIGTGAITDLGFATPTDNSSAGSAINHFGAVAGISTGRTGNRACLWTPSNGWEELGTLGGTTSAARAVNDKGDVVGESATASGSTHAFLWIRGATNGVSGNPQMLDLGTLPGDAFSVATAVDNSRNVFGFSAVAADETPRAFISHVPRMRLIPGPLGFPIPATKIKPVRVIEALSALVPVVPGWEFRVVTATSAAGHIVGWGQRDGLTLGFRLTRHATGFGSPIIARILSILTSRVFAGAGGWAYDPVSGRWVPIPPPTPWLHTAALHEALGRLSDTQDRQALIDLVESIAARMESDASELRKMLEQARRDKTLKS